MKQHLINDKIRLVYKNDLIFRLVFESKGYIDRKTAEEAVRILGEWSSGVKRRGTLIDAQSLMYLDSDVRSYFASQSRDNLVGLAIVIRSEMQRSLANLYMKFTRQATPTKVFTNERDAEDWLHSLINRT